MQYRTLGKTGLKVSTVGFGGIKLGGISQDQTNEIVRMAVEGGMNYFDTARVYGDSEIRLGEAIKGIRDKVIISSKGIRRDLNGFKTDFETSMRNLQTDYIDILFIHDVSTEENWSKVRKNGILDYALELKAAGRIRHIACSTHDSIIGAKMINSDYFEAVMVAYNPANPETEKDLIPLAKSKNMGIVIMKPFGGGVLTEERSKQLGFEITAEDCLRFAASNADVTTVIPGLDKPEYVELALKVGSSELTMTQEEHYSIISKVSIKGKNYCRGCGYCKPCPVNIPIPAVLQLYNRWEVYGGVDWSQMHSITEEYTKNVSDEVTADKCISCNACRQRCPYNLPISDLMKEASGKLRRY
jgi:uncharacterized protein